MTESAAVDDEPDQRSVARAILLRQLTAAPRSRAQLATKLAERGVPDEIAAEVLDRYVEVGLIDDAEYARMLVRSRHAERGMSRRALGMELRRKGIDDDLATDALGEVDDAQEEGSARALVRRKLASTAGLDRDVRVRRTYAALARRGYSSSLVSKLVREELDAEGAAGDYGSGGYGSGGYGSGGYGAAGHGVGEYSIDE
ncbi:regulatory protein RecX [Cellulomonas hominis]